MGIDSFGQNKDYSNSVNNPAGTVGLRYSPAVRNQSGNDTFEITTGDQKSKKKMSAGKKWAIAIGSVACAAIAGVLMHKAISVNRVTRELSAIDTKFARLEAKLPEVRKKFSEIFMREDLSLEQTKEMLARYKELERMRVNGAIPFEDYVRAVFDEASRNYGLSGAGIKLYFDPLKDTKVGGYWQALANRVVIKDNVSREYAFGCIHHELRHARQSQAIAECLPDEQIASYLQKLAYDDLIKSGIKCGDFESWVKSVWTPDFTQSCITDFKSRMVGARLARTGVKPTAKEVEYAKSMFEGQKDYVSIDDNFFAYWKNPKEVDARSAEGSINKLFGLNRLEYIYRKILDRVC